MSEPLSEIQTWAFALLTMVYQPMIARKTGRFPLDQILLQYPADDREKLRQGVEALVDLNILAREGRDICITNRSEALLQGLGELASWSRGAAVQFLESAPALSSILGQIDKDLRLDPVATPLLPTAGRGKRPAAPASSTSHSSIGGMIFAGISLVLVLLGLVQLLSH